MKAVVIATLTLLGSFSAVGAEDDQQALIKQGEYLARAGDCVACHTVKGGKPFAGGLAMETPIGTIYSTNITPDPSASGLTALRTSIRRCVMVLPKMAAPCTRPCPTPPTLGSIRPICRPCMLTL